MVMHFLMTLVQTDAPLTCSLDAFVQGIRDLMQGEGWPALLAQWLQVYDVALLRQWRQGTLAPPACCAAPAYAVHMRRSRRLRTSLGTITFTWRQLRCRQCGHLWVPLRDALGLTAHQSHSVELQQHVVEQSSQQSYRRMAAALETQGLHVPKSTAQTWVRHDQDAVPTPAVPTTPILLADGTNYHRRPATPGGSTRGEIRLVLGMSATGALLPVGEWSGVSWEAIGRAIAPTGPVAVCLVSDGEPGLQEGLAHLVTCFQRCHWHLVHDLDVFLMADGVDKALRRSWQHTLQEILALALPPRAHGRGTPTERAQITQALAAREEALDLLIGECEAAGWHHTVTYLRRAQPQVFTYLRCWLHDGLHVPRVTSRMERVMKEVGRRVKAIAQGWTEAGAAQMTGCIVEHWLHLTHWLAAWARRGARATTPQLRVSVVVT